MRISDWSSYVCSSDLVAQCHPANSAIQPALRKAAITGRLLAATSPSPKAAHSALIFALQSEAAPGCMWIVAGAGFALSAAKTALSASHPSRLAFTEDLRSEYRLVGQEGCITGRSR